MSQRVVTAIVIVVLLAAFVLVARWDRAAGEPSPVPWRSTEHLPTPPLRHPTATSSTTTTTVPPTTTTTHSHPPRQPVVTTPPRSGECGGWLSTVQAYFPADQVSKACRVLYCESQGNPNAKNPRSTASGLFQFLDSTWATVTGTAPPARAYSPDTQVTAAAKLWASSGWAPWVCR